MGNQAGIIIRNVKNELFHSAKRLILNEVKGIECLQIAVPMGFSFSRSEDSYNLPTIKNIFVMKTVKTSKELGGAIKSNEDYIYVEGNLKNKVIRIKTTGKKAWALAVGSLAAAITSYLTLPATLTVSTTAGGPVGTAVGGAISFSSGVVPSTVVATALGVKAAAVAIGIGEAFGGVG